MKKALSFLWGIVEKNTSGFPFILWSAGGMAVGLFVFIFRDAPNVNFEKLMYIIPISGVWFIGSDIIKKKGIFDPRSHFAFDSAFYLLLFGAIVYLTGGLEGDLLFIFFLATISAPLFGKKDDTLIFTFLLSLTAFLVYFVTDKDLDGYDAYSIGVILLESILFFVVAGTLRYFIKEISRKEAERANDLERMVGEKTLQLEGKVSELERFKNLTVNRELKMIELKKELAQYKEVRNKKIK